MRPVPKRLRNRETLLTVRNFHALLVIAVKRERISARLTNQSYFWTLIISHIKYNISNISFNNSWDPYSLSLTSLPLWSPGIVSKASQLMQYPWVCGRINTPRTRNKALPWFSVALGFCWVSIDKKIKQQHTHLHSLLSSNRIVLFVNKQNLFSHLTFNKWDYLEKFLLHI